MAIDTNELIRKALKRIAQEGDLLVLDVVYSQYCKVHMVGVNGRIHTTFNEDYGKRLWRAAEFWGLTATKRYTRAGKNGLCVEIANDKEFLAWLDAPAPTLPVSDVMPVCSLCGSGMDVELLKPIDLLICATCRAEVS